MKVITLNSEVFSNKCSELIFKIDFLPDIIIGVLDGGGYVLDDIIKKGYFESAQFNLVKIKNSDFKEYFIIKSILKVLPNKISNYIRILESRKTRRSIKDLNLNKLTLNRIDFNLNSDLMSKFKNILIIDDAIDTGKTMFIVKNNLANLFPQSQIKTAVISWTIEDSIIEPDYYLFKNILVRFPWSKDYKGRDFEKKNISS
jgi:uncharacterized protein